MIRDIMQLLIETALTLALYLFLLRFILNLAGAPFHHPLPRAILMVTDPVVLPLRRILPRLGRFDVATFLPALLAAWLQMLFNILGRATALPGLEATNWLLSGWLAVIRLLDSGLLIFKVLLFVQILLSWLKPGDPLQRVLDPVTEPILRPIRRVLPNLGGLDLSPIVAYLGCSILELVLARLAALPFLAG